MKANKSKDNPWVAAGVVGGLGVVVAVCVVAGYWLGALMSAKFGGSPGWVVGGIMTGLTVGILSAIWTIRAVLEGSDG